MIWPGRGTRDDEPRFIAAGPTFGERASELWHRSRADRRIAPLAYAALLPGWALARAAAACGAAARHAVSRSLQGLRARRWRDLLQGVPAVLAFAAAAAAVILARGQRPDLAATYRNAAAAAFREEKWEDAKLYFERLFRLDGGTAETRFLLGLSLERLGAADEAESLIRGVAEGDAGGDPRANRWLAAKLLATEGALRDPRRSSEAYRHLAAAERGLPNDAAVKLDLAKYHLAVGETPAAISKLSAAAAIEPALNYELARLLSAAGDAAAALRAMARAESHFKRRLESTPGDRAARLALSSCLATLGRADEAVATLRTGMAVDPDGPCAAAAAGLYLAAYDRLAAQQSPDDKAMIAVLRQALSLDPNSAGAAARLASFGEPAGTSGTPASLEPGVEREARELLEGLLAAGEQPAAVHMALGLKASRRGATDEARWHFERAYDLDRSLTGVANNLAWTLSHDEPPELGRALAVIDAALAEAPAVPAFLDTRAEIYRGMGRWEEALADFERALPAFANDERFHRSLADVYGRLGKSTISAKHLREAERLAAGSPQPGRDATPAGAAATPPPGAPAGE